MVIMIRSVPVSERPVLQTVGHLFNLLPLSQFRPSPQTRSDGISEISDYFYDISYSR